MESPASEHIHPDRFAPFTRNAREALTLAQEEAQRLGQDAVAPEHILLGILKLGGSDGWTILQNGGVDILRLRRDLEAISRSADPVSHRATHPARLDAQGLSVIRRARDEAKGRVPICLGTAHLVLGMLLKGGPSAALLAQGGVMPDTVRHFLAQVPEQEGPWELPPKGSAQDAGQSITEVDILRSVSVQVLDILDLLVDAGIYPTRSQAVVALFRTGLAAQSDLIGRLGALARQLSEVVDSRNP